MSKLSSYYWDDLKKEVPEWFRDAKFGLFFHWGPYSVPAFENEWYSRNMYAKGLSQNLHHVETYGPLNEFGYKDFYPMFKGEKFDPEEWSDLVVRSGAKYAGPVTEHADNFSMWNSKVNPINCMNYGPKRDIAGECAKAFRKKGIKVLATFHHQWLWGWFMSTDNEADVYVPENEVYYGKALPLETNRYAPYRLPNDDFNIVWRNKVIEVIEKYNPDALYFDSRTNIIDERYRYEMVDYYYNISKHTEGVITYKQEDFPADIGVYDIECGRFSEAKPFAWQTDDRLEDNITWCMVQNPKYKSGLKIIHQLCDVVAKNGNLLLNVGPYADGSFHEDAKKSLYEVGDWLKLNGEAIYGTRPFSVASEGPTSVQDANYDVNRINDQLDNGLASDIRLTTFSSQDFRFTRKDGYTYAIALGWPEDNKLKIRTLSRSGPLPDIKKVTLLANDTLIPFIQTEDGLELTLPEQKPCEAAFAFRIEA
ncbi:MAG TPA: alpha-L-fucosidase [Clostridiales bacterium]|nr:alpha-L-fucosidase [Clostridiales bacterium]